MSKAKKRVLVLLGCYRPGHFSTGPNQSFRAFAAGLKDEFDISVVSSDQKGFANTEWQNDGYANCRQVPRGLRFPYRLWKLLRTTPHDLLLLNGFNDREFTIPALLLRRWGLVPRKPVVLSPRGEFAAGALSLKSTRKRLWMAVAGRLGLTKDIWFHATAPHERAAIERMKLASKGILEAPNARTLPVAPDGLMSNRPITDCLRLVFLGRVTPVKNLPFAFRVLATVQAQISFDVFGPSDDPAYQKLVEGLAANLPENVTVRFRGNLAHDDVFSTLSDYDLLFQPTRGENFGHVIHEALSAGLPLLISDQTPWRDLQSANVGWDLPLDEPERFTAAVESFARMTGDERRDMRRAARALAEKSFVESDALVANRNMLMRAMDEWAA